MIVLAAIVVSIAAGIRSTWSPCGVSMLSTITPLAERSRGRRYGVTAAWFVSGALVGGLAFGAIAALGALVVSVVGPGHAVVGAVAAVGALGAATLDSGMVPPALPHHRRQVNELWLDRYRGWVYGVGFGAQIGLGLATFIMTAAVYLTVLLGALTGRPLVALAVGATFGLVRGLAVLAGAGLTSPDALARFHQRFEGFRQPVTVAVIALEWVVALGVAATAGPVPAVLVLLVFAVVALGRVSRRIVLPDAGSAPATVPTDHDWTVEAR